MVDAPRRRHHPPRHQTGQHPDRQHRPQRGLVKITDFGISHAKDDVTLTQTGIVTRYTRLFRAGGGPWQLPSEASDVILTRRHHLPIDALRAAAVRCRRDSPSRCCTRWPPRSIRSPKPVRSRPILRKLLEPAPARRPTMAQARDELAAVAAAATHTSRDQVLTGVPHQKDGAVIWIEATYSDRGHSTGDQEFAEQPTGNWRRAQSARTRRSRRRPTAPIRPTHRRCRRIVCASPPTDTSAAPTG